MLAATCLALAMLGALPSRSRACTCVPDAILASEPADGARDVPIDVAPIIEGPFEPDSVTLAEEDGAAVVFELNTSPGTTSCTGGNAELRLAADLEPDTTYVLRAENADGDTTTVRFSTGSKRVPERELDAPEVRATFIEGNLIRDSCSLEIFGCVAAPGTPQVEVIGTRGDDVLFRAFTGVDLYIDHLEHAPDCIEVRERDAAGRRSEPTTLCGDDLPFRPARASDFPDTALDCHGGMIGPGDGADAGTQEADAGDSTPDRESNGGCAVSTTDGSTASTALLLLCASLLARRKRKAI